MKIFIILTSILLLTKFSAIAQTDSNEVFSLVEKMPSFPGGDAKLSEFLTTNFEFSKDTKLEKCFYVLIIGKTGEIVSVSKLKGDVINEEKLITALKKTSGKWTPPSQNGYKVNVKQPLTIDIIKNQINVKVLVTPMPNKN